MEKGPAKVEPEHIRAFYCAHTWLKYAILGKADTGEAAKGARAPAPREYNSQLIQQSHERNRETCRGKTPTHNLTFAARKRPVKPALSAPERGPRLSLSAALYTYLLCLSENARPRRHRGRSQGHQQHQQQQRRGQGCRLVAGDGAPGRPLGAPPEQPHRRAGPPAALVRLLLPVQRRRAAADVRRLRGPAPLAGNHPEPARRPVVLQLHRQRSALLGPGLSADHGLPQPPTGSTGQRPRPRLGQAAPVQGLRVPGAQVLHETVRSSRRSACFHTCGRVLCFCNFTHPRLQGEEAPGEERQGRVFYV